MAKAKKQTRMKSGGGAGSGPFTQALKVNPGFVLADLEPHSTPGYQGTKTVGAELMAKQAPELCDLQEQLHAASTAGGKASILLVLQGMDTSGKGGITRHVIGPVGPQGVRYKAFKAPTKEEREQPFLQRINAALPQPGQIGVFDRSHYEDVLIARVHNLVPPETWASRYGLINTFERTVSQAGTTIVKVMLHISSDEQKARLAKRLERPDKHWKYNPGDVDERQLWSAYQTAYQVAITKCSTQDAPWFVVPADRKWYARLAVQQLILEHLRAMGLQWPVPTFDVEAEKRRLAAT